MIELYVVETHCHHITIPHRDSKVGQTGEKDTINSLLI